MSPYHSETKRALALRHCAVDAGIGRPEMRLVEAARKRSRRGAAVLVAMVCLCVLAVVIAALVKMSTAERTRLQTDAERLQADVLAESAMDRAAAKLAADPKYRGETWTLSAGELGGDEEATAAIRVEPVDGKPNMRLVKIQADYPNQLPHRIRRSLQAAVVVP
jgi:hypothetical protein